MISFDKMANAMPQNSGLGYIVIMFFNIIINSGDPIFMLFEKRGTLHLSIKRIK